MSDKKGKDFFDINLFIFNSSLKLRRFISSSIASFSTAASIYYLYYEHIFNGILALGVLGVGILLALIAYEKLVDRLVSKLPLTELNGRRVYILSSKIPDIFVTSTLKPKIIVTDAALNSYSNEELNALLEHELGHIELKHVLIGAIYNIPMLTLYVGLMALFGFPTLFYLVDATLLFSSSNFRSIANKFPYYVDFGSSPFALVLLLFLFIEAIASGYFYDSTLRLPRLNIAQMEADWYAVNKVGKEVYLRVLNKIKQDEEEEKKVRHPKLYWLDKFIIRKNITLDERINIIENGSYEPFSYKETMKFLSPIIFLISVVASLTFTYTISSFVNFDYIFSYIFLIILNLVMLFSSMVLLMVLSAVIYFILRSLGIKEYLARTSILAYYVITSLFFLFPGVIEGIIISLVAVTVAVLISSSEGKLGRAIIGWGLVYIIFLGVLTWLTLLGVI